MDVRIVAAFRSAKKINEVVEQNQACRAKSVKVRLGDLAFISAAHFREHFNRATVGTPDEGAWLDIDTSDDIDDLHAQDIMLVSLEIET